MNNILPARPYAKVGKGKLKRSRSAGISCNYDMFHSIIAKITVDEISCYHWVLRFGAVLFYSTLQQRFAKLT
jgi:hypothetical protein